MGWIYTLIPKLFFHNLLIPWFTNWLSGNYSCLAAKFQLHRSIGFHLVQSYVPTILIVIVSWVSFWMDVEHVPGRSVLSAATITTVTVVLGRVALGVTTLLTISSKSAGLSSETPQVSYVKASLYDVWLEFDITFIKLFNLNFLIFNMVHLYWINIAVFSI